MSGTAKDAGLASPTTAYTYHCLCSNLLFATTHRISALPRRAPPGLDRAYILPCPPLPQLKEPKVDSASASEDSEGAESDEDDEDAGRKAGKDQGDALTMEKNGYTLLVSLALPAREPPVLVRRSDGFEKRWMLKCGRCKLAVAYQLDWSQFPQGQSATGTGAAGGTGSQGEKRGRRDDLVYLLPGGFMTTEEMKAGKKFTEDEMSFASTA